MIAFIRTPAGVTMVLADRPVSVAVDSPLFDEVLELLKAGADEADILAVVNRKVDELALSMEAIGDSGVAIREDGLVTLHGKVVDNSLSSRMLQMREEGFDLVPMANFLANLERNPSYRSRKELYTFLEAGNMPITQDGYFMAYKIVRPDYKDYHSGRFDNSVGQVVEMPRSDVDDDSNNTCSSGLHFCSLDYLSHFGGPGGHVMLLKVNPADVVSIPADYNNTKGRCCKYEVVGEYTDYDREHPKPAFSFSVYGSDDICRCPNCGERVEEGMSYCPECGTELNEPYNPTCPECGSEVGPDDRFCSTCGTEL